MNSNKTEFMCLKQEAISTQRDKPLNLIDHLRYLGNNISSVENDVNKCLVKVWNATERLSIIWKSDLSDKIKWYFFKVYMYIWIYRSVYIYFFHTHKYIKIPTRIASTVGWSSSIHQLHLCSRVRPYPQWVSWIWH